MSGARARAPAAGTHLARVPRPATRHAPHTPSDTLLVYKPNPRSTRHYSHDEISHHETRSTRDNLTYLLTPLTLIMCSTKCLVAFLVTCWACWSATSAAPTHDTIKMDLAEVLEKSVCPIRVVIDEDKTRTPRYIKTLTCDKKPNPVCRDQHIAHACCHHKHIHYSTECVELIDQVVVRYAGEDKPQSIPVPVGCACMIREGTPAHDISP